MLESISIQNFRCIKDASLEFDPQINSIVGPNGSGKTSLLEAIYFLSHGRSFRTNVRDRLIRIDSEGLTVVGRATGVSGHHHTVGIELRNAILDCRVDGHDAKSVAEAAVALPVHSIDPSIHRIIEEGSSRRRRLLDWGVFHVKHSFLSHWRRYQRALRQRNAALRGGNSDAAVNAWTEELSSAGEQIDLQRKLYANALREHFERVTSKFFSSAIEFEYRRGWAEDSSLYSAILASTVADRQGRTTRVGPHRADLIFRMGNASARDVVSRGQQKLLATAFVLAQLSMHAVTSPGVRTTLLLDDPGAELDVDNLGKLLSVASTVQSQLILSALSANHLPTTNRGRMFHVEQGEVARVL